LRPLTETKSFASLPILRCGETAHWPRSLGLGIFGGGFELAPGGFTWMLLAF